MDRNQRERLKEIHQTDLTSSRVHEEFLDWLRTKGVSWLLFILVAMCLYFGILRWKAHRVNYQTEAWVELADAALPSGLEDVAEKYADVGSVAALARLRAAGQLLNAVQREKTLGAATEEQKDLTAEERTEYLNRAERLYAKIVEADDHSPGMTLTVASALFGRAAVAEARSDLQAAREFYQQAAARSEPQYPRLAERARLRAETVDEQGRFAALPGAGILTALQTTQSPTPQLDPITMDPWIEELILPK